MRKLFFDNGQIGTPIHGDQYAPFFICDVLKFVEGATHHAVVRRDPAVRAERGSLKRENQC
jgi:hypothetical protein